MAEVSAKINVFQTFQYNIHQSPGHELSSIDYVTNCQEQNWHIMLCKCERGGNRIESGANVTE